MDHSPVPDYQAEDFSSAHPHPLQRSIPVPPIPSQAVPSVRHEATSSSPFCLPRLKETGPQMVVEVPAMIHHWQRGPSWTMDMARPSKPRGRLLSPPTTPSCPALPDWLQLPCTHNPVWDYPMCCYQFHSQTSFHTSSCHLHQELEMNPIMKWRQWKRRVKGSRLLPASMPRRRRSSRIMKISRALLHCLGEASLSHIRGCTFSMD